MSDIPYSVIETSRRTTGAVSAVPDGNIQMSLLSIGGRTLDWTQMGQDILGNTAGDVFGSSTAMSNNGNIIAVGAYGSDDGITQGGKVKVYSWNASTSLWVQRGADINGTEAYGFLGISLAMSGDGNSFIVGASSFSAGIGKVFIYVWNGSAWVTRNSQTIQGDTGTYFGSNVAMSNDGNIIAVGEQNSNEGGTNSGRVLVYEWNSSTSLWVLKDKIVGSSGEQLSWCSLSDYGNVLAVGGYTANNVRIYSFVETKYVQRGSSIIEEVGGDNAFRSNLSGDGNTVAIGATLNDDNGTNAGHVRVFDWNGSAWVKRGADIDGEAAGDQSGVSLQLSASGNVLAIGAISNSGGGPNAGHMRIYIWTGTAWQKLGSDIDGVSPNTGGRNISLSGDGTRVIFDETLHNSGVGRIRAYGINVLGSYAIVPTVPAGVTAKGSVIQGELAGDQFGYSTALSNNGNRVAVGGNRNDTGGGNSGHIRVYEWNGSAWGQLGVDLDGTVGSSEYGISVAINGDGSKVIGGAPSNASPSLDYARLWEWNGATWTGTLFTSPSSSVGNHFGTNVAINYAGDFVAIGDITDGTGGTNSGRVDIWQYTTSWTLYQTLTGNAGDRLYSCNFNNSGNVIAVGADVGNYVKVYEGPAPYSQKGNTINGEAAGDQAFKISLSGDGNTIAIGAPFNDGGGTSSGHVRVYDYNSGTSTWVQRGADIDGQGVNFYAGQSVSLSSDGNRVVFGEYGNSTGGTLAGAIRIFDWSGSAWVQVGSDINGTAGDLAGFGTSLSGDGSTLVLDAYGSDVNGTDSGKVQMYSITSGTSGVTTSNLTPQPEDIRIDYSQAHPVTTSVAVYNASAPTVQLSSNTISTAGDYIVKYTATDTDSSSTVKTVKVTKV